MTDTSEEWGPWIEHDGKGMPCHPKEITHTIDRYGEEWIAEAGAEINVCQYGSSWVWEDYDPLGCEIIRYRIRNPRGLTILQSLLETLPEREGEDA